MTGTSYTCRQIVLTWAALVWGAHVSCDPVFSREFPRQYPVHSSWPTLEGRKVTPRTHSVKPHPLQPTPSPLRGPEGGIDKRGLPQAIDTGFTWLTSSRVGAITSTMGGRPRLLEIPSFINFSRRGKTNERVFPVPVLAWPITSLPSYTWSKVLYWMGNRNRIPFSLSFLRVTFEIRNFDNFPNFLCSAFGSGRLSVGVTSRDSSSPSVEL